ncbi:MAG: helical backbone metal receptor [Mariprofundales bacterium]
MYDLKTMPITMQRRLLIIVTSILIISCLFFIFQDKLTAQTNKHEHILALSPHVCDILIALNAQTNIVGKVDYCDISAPLVGDYARLYTEAVLARKPTLAIAFDANMQGLDLLRAAGVRVMISHPHNVAEVLDEVLRIGNAAGYAEQAQLLEHDLKQKLLQLNLSNKLNNKLNNKNNYANTPTVFLELWSNPLITAGKPALLSDVLRHIGTRNVFEKLTMESPRVSVESVLQIRPDIVFIPDTNPDAIKRVSFWQQWLGKKVPVCIVAFADISRPSVRLFSAMQVLQQQVQKIERSMNCGK